MVNYTGTVRVSRPHKNMTRKGGGSAASPRRYMAVLSLMRHPPRAGYVHVLQSILYVLLLQHLQLHVERNSIVNTCNSDREMSDHFFRSMGVQYIIHDQNLCRS